MVFSSGPYDKSLDIEVISSPRPRIKMGVSVESRVMSREAIKKLDGITFKYGDITASCCKYRVSKFEIGAISAETRILEKAITLKDGDIGGI